MPGETDLLRLIATMRPELCEGVYVFVTVPQGAHVPSGLEPVMWFREHEGTTLIAPREQAEAAGLEGAFPCRMVTLAVHSSLEAVGFLAAVTARLAAAGMGVNPVSAFFHDHLFLPADRAEEAVEILRAMAAEAVSQGGDGTRP